ncbi:hypothetical protein FACS1894184_13380 [Clostridia bacterium]|nr:hypothetical protein FACS1894184_13380 [Clostridia bacterium]
MDIISHVIAEPITEAVVMPETRLPVAVRADLCVIGGSCTGVFASIRAARLGLNVVLIEKQNSFGGVATQGLVTIWHALSDMTGGRQIIAGLTQETLDRLHKRGGYLTRDNRTSYFTLNTEELKIELDELVLEQKRITPLLHASYCAPLLDNGELTGVAVATKSGLRAVLADRFIDATGDGDLLRDINAPCSIPADPQPPSPTMKVFGMESIAGDELHTLMHNHGSEFGLPPDWGWGSPVPGAPNVTFHADSHVKGFDCSSWDGLTAAELESRRQIRAVLDLVRRYRADVPVTLLDMAAYLGIRETRHFDCLHHLTEDDLLGGVRFADGIANGTYPVDVHHTDKPGLTFKYLDGSSRYVRDGFLPEEGTWLAPGQRAPDYYQIPYRSLVPVSGGNVICAGRMLDADRNAYGAVRVMVNLNQTGEAAGVAAYLGMNEGKGFESMNEKKLRATLAAGGSAVM